MIFPDRFGAAVAKSQAHLQARINISLRDAAMLAEPRVGEYRTKHFTSGNAPTVVYDMAAQKSIQK